MNLISGARYLVDTNILVHSVNQEAPNYRRARTLLESGREEGVSFVVAHQNLLEFIAVLTRGYSVDLKNALSDARAFASQFEVIFPLPFTFERFLNLASKSPHTSYPFDLYLAATMLDNNVERIITANPKDFHGIGLAEIITL